MNPRALLTLLCGLGLASVSVYFVHSELSRTPDTRVVRAEPSVDLGSVVVASADLDYAQRLRPEHLRVAPWPRDALPAGAFPSIEAVLGDGDKERVVLKAMVEGEPVLATKISGFGAKATLSSRLDDDKRAVSIRVNDVSGVAGFLLPGDRVDVLLTRAANGERHDLMTDVILQNVVVLGIDQQSDEDREKPLVARTATVEVSPQQAQKLALAMQVGTLSLALRNIETVEDARPRTVRVSDLVQNQAPREAAVSVRVRRGAAVRTERVLFN